LLVPEPFSQRARNFLSREPGPFVIDAWFARAADFSEMTAADFALAGYFLRRLDLPLRTLDALHISIAQRLDATLVTFDRRMADSARALGMAVATP
jgi:predicted nucleic acid-binding protein